MPAPTEEMRKKAKERFRQLSEKEYVKPESKSKKDIAKEKRN